MMMFLRNKSASRAVVQDGLLTVVCPSANPPFIWRYDVMTNRTFSILMKEGEVDWEIVLKTPAGGVLSIAVFDNRTAAGDVFHKIQNALFSAKYTFLRMVARVVLGLMALVVIWFIFGQYIMQPLRMSNVPVNVPKVMSRTVPEGVPLSADAVLQIEAVKNAMASGSRDPRAILSAVARSSAQAPAQQNKVQAPIKAGVPQTADDVLKAPH